MPLKRAELAVETAPVAVGFQVYLAELASANADTRRRAANALGHHEAQAAADRKILDALAAQLDGERDVLVREAIFAAIGMIGGAAAACALAPLVRLDDAALRNGALETLKHLQSDAVEAVNGLLADADADVRLLTVEVMRSWPPAVAMPRLRALLAGETHVNVMGAVLDVAAAVGDASLLPALGACQARFAGEGFIEFALAEAMKSLAPRAAQPEKHAGPTRKKPAAAKPRKAGR